MADGDYAALSALSGYSKAAAVVSNNIANMYTEDFVKSRVVMQESRNSGVDVLVSKTKKTEITAEEKRGTDPAGEHRPDYTKIGSEVNLAEEFVHLTLYQRGFEASLKSLETNREMLGAILHVIG